MAADASRPRSVRVQTRCGAGQLVQERGKQPLDASLERLIAELNRLPQHLILDPAPERRGQPAKHRPHGLASAQSHGVAPEQTSTRPLGVETARGQQLRLFAVEPIFVPGCVIQPKQRQQVDGVLVGSLSVS